MKNVSDKSLLKMILDIVGEPNECNAYPLAFNKSEGFDLAKISKNALFIVNQYMISEINIFGVISALEERVNIVRKPTFNKLINMFQNSGDVYQMINDEENVIINRCGFDRFEGTYENLCKKIRSVKHITPTLKKLDRKYATIEHNIKKECAKFTKMEWVELCGFWSQSFEYETYNEGKK